MKKTKSALVALVTMNVCCVLWAIGQPAWSADGAARISEGSIQGVVQGDLTVYRGVPFAAPPIGELRWRDPQPVKPWTGVRSATEFANSCSQPITPFMPAGKSGEDCLYLNVWAPATAPKKPLPVMVWIHGGGFTTGGGAAPFFDGTRFAHRGVVFVSINYRLGALGYLAHPELSKASGGTSGNFGLKDQIAALQWVRKNIAALGGDPNVVTIFGQSAGAGSVSLLAASPLAKGLFHRVIAQSGFAFEPPSSGGGMISTLAEAEQQGVSALAELGVAGIAAARELPAEKFAALKMMFRPLRDGRVLPVDQLALYERNGQNDTPALIGYNSLDVISRPMKPADFESEIRKQYGAGADAILSAYPHATESERARSAREVSRDSGFGWSALTWARVQSAHSRNPVFTYYFDQVAPKDSIFFSPDGTVHTGEVPYVFGTLDAPPASYTEEDRKLSGQVQQYWVNFAQTGDPNGPGLPEWPAFRSEQPRSMLFHAAPLAVPMPNLDRLNVFDTYYRAMRSAPAK